MSLFKFGHSLVDKMRQLFKEDLPSHVISGMTGPTDAGLTHTITSGVASVDGYRIALSATGHTYTASRDTYVDLSIIGVLTFVEVANAAGEPGITANSMRFLKVVTDGSAITASDRFKGTGFLGSGITVPMAKAHRTTNLSLTNSVSTVVPLNAEDFDNDVIHDIATNNSRLTVKTAGKYVVIAQARFTANATGIRTLEVTKNGVSTDRFPFVSEPSSSASVVTLLSCSGVVDMAVNDYVEIEVFQNSGGALDLMFQHTFLSIHRIG